MSLILLLKFICLCEVPGPVEMMDEDMCHDLSLVPAGDTQGPVRDHEDFSNCATQSSEIFLQGCWPLVSLPIMYPVPSVIITCTHIPNLL